MSTRQRIFDKVKERAANSVKAYDAGADLCRYRMPDTGLPCFIGALIEDKFYQPALEGSCAGSCHVIAALIASGYPVDGDKDANFLRHLQGIHDEQDPDTWAAELEEFAEGYDLNP